MKPVSAGLGGIQIAKVLSSLLLISFVLWVIRFLPSVCFSGLVVLSIGIGLREFYSLLAHRGIPCFNRLGIAIGMAGGVILAIPDTNVGAAMPRTLYEPTLLMALFVVIIGALIDHDISGALLKISGTVFGILYVGFLAGYLIALSKLPHGRDLASLVFIVTWAGDAGAYGIGSMFRRRGHLLCPRISPHKTIEGAIAGLCFAVIFAFLTKQLFFRDQSALHFVVLGILLGITGQFGDLAESLLKRSAGVKDTGRLLPLHGGILDRIDGLLFTAPVLYYCARFVFLM